MASKLQHTAQRSWQRFLEMLLLDLAGELALPARINGHRWWREPDTSS